MEAFFQAGNCFVPYGNVRYIIDRGDVITVHLHSRTGDDAQFELIIVEGEDIEPFRRWLIDSTDGPQQEQAQGVLGFQQGAGYARAT